MLLKKIILPFLLLSFVSYGNAAVRTYFSPAASETLAVANRQRAADFNRSKPLLTNGLANPRYHLPGAEVSHADCQTFINEFIPTFKLARSWEREFLGAGAIQVVERLKTSESLFVKMRGRFHEGFTLDRVNDVVGVRAIARDLAGETRLVSFVNHHFFVVVHLDYVKHKKSDGYRAHHFTIRAETGRLVEIQIQTLNQNKFASFTHDRIYKDPENRLEKNAEVLRYLNALSDRLFAQDCGNPPNPVPPSPPILIRRGILFGP